MNRLESVASEMNETHQGILKILIDSAYLNGAKPAPNRRQIGAKPAPNRRQSAPNPSRRRASSPSGKNNNNNNTLSLSKNPTLKAGKNSDKDAGEPKAEKETPPRLTHKFFVGLLDTFGEEHPEYLTEAVKAAWSEFVTHRQNLDTRNKFGSKTAALSVLKEMHKLSSKMKEPAAHAEGLLRVATEKRWRTLYELKEEEKADDDDPDAYYHEMVKRNLTG